MPKWRTEPESSRRSSRMNLLRRGALLSVRHRRECAEVASTPVHGQIRQLRQHPGEVVERRNRQPLAGPRRHRSRTTVYGTASPGVAPRQPGLPAATDRSAAAAWLPGPPARTRRGRGTNIRILGSVGRRRAGPCCWRRRRPCRRDSRRARRPGRSSRGAYQLCPRSTGRPSPSRRVDPLGRTCYDARPRSAYAIGVSAPR